MKRNVIVGFATLLAGTLLAADPTPKDTVTGAAKKLGEAANYSWRTTVVVPDDSPFKPGPTEGKTEKDGFTLVSMTFREDPIQIVMKGGKAVFKDQDGAWVTSAEAENSEGPGRFMGMMVRNLKAPATEAADLAAVAKELKKDGEVITSDMTEAGAKTYLSMRRRGGGDAPAVTNAKGSMKFWLKDGVLSKYEYKIQGQIDRDGNPMEVDRATTVEIKDVGTSKFTVPEDAKKKLT